jgi:hypothetical protein
LRALTVLLKPVAFYPYDIEAMESGGCSLGQGIGRNIHEDSRDASNEGMGADPTELMDGSKSSNGGIILQDDVASQCG